MIYTAIDTFYLTDEQLKDSPSRRDGIDEETETTLRIYGCDLIQESGILLKLPQMVMATGQVLFHRFYCKKSFVKFSVKRVAASCVWLASKLEQCPREVEQVIIVFHRMEYRRENLPIKLMDDEKYRDLEEDLIKTERHLLKEMGFICHVEHPHKFISNYLRTLEAPDDLRQVAWNLANDSLRTTLCVRFKSEVVACGVVFATARRFHVALPENPPWWLVFDADKAGINEVCRVLAHLYARPKAQYIPVFKGHDSFIQMRKRPDQQVQVQKETLLSGKSNRTSDPKAEIPNPNGSSCKEAVKSVLDKLKESKKNDADNKHLLAEVDNREDSLAKPKGDYKSDANTERNLERERERVKARDRDSRGRDSDHDSRGKDSDRDRERENDLDWDREKERRHRSKDKETGNSKK